MTRDSFHIWQYSFTTYDFRIRFKKDISGTKIWTFLEPDRYNRVYVIIVHMCSSITLTIDKIVLWLSDSENKTWSQWFMSLKWNLKAIRKRFILRKLAQDIFSFFCVCSRFNGEMGESCFGHPSLFPISFLLSHSND